MIDKLIKVLEAYLKKKASISELRTAFREFMQALKK